MAEPRRRERRNPHLDASAVTIERALLARAAVLEDLVRDDPHDRGAIVADRMAAEFRAFAEELRYW